MFRFWFSGRARPDSQRSTDDSGGNRLERRRRRALERSSRQPAFRPLAFEPLEPRSVFSTSPFLASLLGTNPGPATGATSLTYTAVFSETVTGVDLTDFAVVTTGTAAGTVSQVTPVNGTTFTITVNGVAGNGTLRLDLRDDGTIRNLAGNQLPSNIVQQSVGVGASPYGLALGDLNGDGKIDIVTEGGPADTVAVLLGNGDGTFGAQQTFGLGLAVPPITFAIGDVDGDGKADILSTGANRATVLLGNGDGTFKTPMTSGLADWEPKNVSFGDFNADGKLDFVFAARGGSVHIAFGTGTGTFSNLQQHAVIDSESVRGLDVDGDGKLDLVSVSQPNGLVSVLIGNGDGTFKTEQTYAARLGSESLTAADFNGDGKLDLATANDFDGSISVLLGNGNGTFQAQRSIVAGADPKSIRIGDFNRDGRVDLAFVNNTSAGPGTLKILLGNGDGTFFNPQTMATGVGTLRLEIGDFDGDGRSDIVVANVQDGTLGINLNVARDAYAGQNYTIDQTPPTIVSIDRASPLAELTNATTVTYTVTFGETVTGVDATDFQVVLSGTATGSVTQVTPAGGSVYTVTIGGVAGDGTLGLNLIDNDTIRDLAGNRLDGSNAVSRFSQSQSFATPNAPGVSATADLNGDGKLDLMSALDTGSGLNRLWVWLGNGNGTFQTAQTFEIGQSPVAITVGDLDNDGKLDVLVASRSTNVVGILLGNGDGTFKDKLSPNVSSAPDSIALADVNGDGKLDLAVATRNSGIVGVFLGNGNGTLQARQTFNAGTNVQEVLLRDLNGDGKLDLLASNYSGSVNVRLGNGNGTFQALQTFAAAAGARPLVAADFNGDGKLDAAYVGIAGSSVGVLLGNGNGTFQVQRTYAVGGGPFSLGARDMNGDGLVDLVVGQGTGGSAGSVGIWLGNGNGTFQASQTAALGTVRDSVSLGDFNGDGRVDLLVSKNTVNAVVVLTNVATFLGQTYTLDHIDPMLQSIVRAAPAAELTNTTSVSYTVTFTEAMTGIDAADFVVDVSTGLTASPTVVVTPINASTYTVTVNGIIGNGTLGIRFVDGADNVDLAGNRLVSWQARQTYAAGAKVYSMASGDLDGDGKLDIVTANLIEGTISVLLGNGDGTFKTQVTYQAGAAPFSVSLADLNGDGKLDAVVANNGATDSTVSIMLGNGNGTFKPQQTLTVNYLPDSVTIGDINGDGKLDVGVVSQNYNKESILFGNGDGTFQAVQTFDLGASPWTAKFVDVNSDGRLDLVAGVTGSVRVLLGNGNGTFQPRMSTAVGAGPNLLTVGDVNGDGKVDLVVVDQGAGFATTLLGNGDGTFQPLQTFAVGTVPVTPNLMDLNADGKLDLLVGNRLTATINVLYGNGDGTFGNRQIFSTGVGSLSALVGDWNGDGRLDIAAGSLWGYQVSVFLAAPNGGFASPTYTIDQIPPKFTSIEKVTSTGSVSAARYLVYRVTFDGPVVGVDVADFVLATTGTVAATIAQVTAVNSSVYEVSVANIVGDGTLGLNLVDNLTIRDPAGNRLDTAGLGTTFPGPVVALDHTLPQVQSINRTSPASSIVDATSVVFTITLSEDVAGLDVSDFRLITTGTIVGTIAQVTPISGSVYSLTVNNILGDGTLGLKLVDDDTIHDLAGNHLTNWTGTAAYVTEKTSAVNGNADAFAVGDFDNDGKPDVVTVSTAFNSVTLLQGNGDGSFQTLKVFLGENDPKYVKVADLNGDGNLDIVSSIATNGGSMFVMLGNGDGTFAPRRSFTVGSNDAAITLGDLNHDGRIDLVVGNGATGTATALLGNGDGTFLAVQTFNIAGVAAEVALQDLNGDGNLDLVTANSTGVSAAVLLGNGNGTFAGAQTYDTGSLTKEVEIGDLNADDIPDLVFRSAIATSVMAVLLGNGDGTFQTRQSTSIIAGTSLALGDVNGDGTLDVVVSPTSGTGHPFAILPGNGDGTFAAAQTFGALGTGRSVEIADIDADGRADLVFSYTSGSLVAVHKAAPAATFTGQLYTIYQSAPAVTSIVRAVPVGPDVNAASVGFTVIFTHDVIGVDAADFVILSAGVAGSIVGVTPVNGSVYTVTIGGLIGDGTLGLGFSSGQNIQDGAGHALTATTPSGANETYTTDYTLPQVLSIVGSAAGSITNASNITFTVTFSEAVTGVDVTDFNFQRNGTVSYTTQFTAVSATVYTITAAGITGDGTLGLTFFDDATIRDVAGNRLNQQGYTTHFRLPMTGSTLSGPQALATADMNGDGKLDIIQGTNYDSVGVYLGNGDGNFSYKDARTIGGAVYGVAVGDIDGDGDIDIAGVSSETNSVRLLLGNGTGALTLGQSYATDTQPRAVALADLNGDGKLDLVIANSVSNTVNVLLGNGNGTFKARQTFTAGLGAGALAVGDVNGDGKLDIAVGNRTSTTVSILLGNGNGTFQSQQQFSAATNVPAVALGDVNNDGKLDLVVGGALGGSVLLGNGNGTFKAPVSFAVQVSIVGLAVADMNGDGKLDIAVAGQSSDGMRVFYGSGNGQFSAGETFSLIEDPHAIVAGDFNNDGTIDLDVVGRSSLVSSKVYLNFLGLKTADYTIDHTIPTLTSIARATPTTATTNASSVSYTVTFDGPVSGVDAGDFAVVTSGGLTASSTVVVTPAGASTYTITINGIVGNGTLALNLIDDGTIRDSADNRLALFFTQQTYGGAGNALGLDSADLNGDGRLDVVVADQGGAAVRVFLGNGDGTLQASQSFAVGAGARAVVATDVNADGYLDLIVANSTGNSISVLLGNGNGTFQTQQAFAAVSTARFLAVGDVDGDGKLDIAVAGTASTVGIMLGNGNGTFLAPQTSSIVDTVRSLAFADLNNDGALDLAVGRDAGAAVLLGNGNGTFQTRRMIFASGVANVMTVGDFNVDGKLDLAFIDSNENGRVFLGNGDATYQAALDFSSISPASSLKTADVNLDGKLDLLFVTSGHDVVNVALGNGDATFQTAQSRPSGDFPSATSVGDLNGDNRPDLIVANAIGSSLSVLLSGANGTFGGPTYTIDQLAPTVSGIYARGVGSGSANWNASFLNYLAANNLGDASLGYMLSGGANQLKTLPWTNVNTLSIRFSEEVTIAEGDLLVLGSTNGPTVPVIAGFSWDSATHTGTWTFASALPRGKFLLHLNGTLLDTVGNGLDGEWNVASSTSSGDGTAGGDFNFRFNVLPGDFDGSNGVTITEVLQARNRAGKGTGSVGYTYREDLDGSGGITITEVLQGRNRAATSITGLNEPVAPGSTPQSPFELAPLAPGAEEGDFVSLYPPLTQEELAPLVAEAIARWEASGLVPTGFDWSKLRFAITDLGPAYLGLGNPDGSILLDDDGAGWGWFVDDTPSDDAEFASDSDSQAARHMDLLTVVMHEIGHALGYPTGTAVGTPAETLLSELLTLGTRRTPGVVASEPLASETVPSDLLADESQAAPMLGFTRLAEFDYAPLALGTAANRDLEAPSFNSAAGMSRSSFATEVGSGYDAVRLQLFSSEIETAAAERNESSPANRSVKFKRLSPNEPIRVISDK